MPSTDREEIEALKQKIQRLEELLEQERYGARNNLTARLSDLEEGLDRYRNEVGADVKSAFRGLQGIWHHVGALERRARLHDERIDDLVDANQATRDDVEILQKRVIEIDDSSMLLEERLDALSPPENPTSTDRPTSPSMQNNTDRSMGISAEPIRQDTPLHVLPELDESKSLSLPHIEPLDDVATSKAWSVHVSLLPTASLPFPFEKDTAAYSV